MPQHRRSTASTCQAAPPGISGSAETQLTVARHGAGHKLGQAIPGSAGAGRAWGPHWLQSVPPCAAQLTPAWRHPGCQALVQSQAL